MDIFTFDKEFTNYLGEALISKYPADELFNGRGGYVYVFKFNNNAYRLLADFQNEELIFQVLAVGYVTKSGDFGYDDAHDYASVDGDTDNWLDLASTWIDECETSSPDYTEYENSYTDIMSSKGGTNMKFTFDPKRRITAAEEEKGRTLEEIVDEKCDNVEDDFDYIISGIDKLCREDRCQEAMEVLDILAEALDAAIGSIGDKIAEESFNSEE